MATASVLPRNASKWTVSSLNFWREDQSVLSFDSALNSSRVKPESRVQYARELCQNKFLDLPLSEGGQESGDGQGWLSSPQLIDFGYSEISFQHSSFPGIYIHAAYKTGQRRPNRGGPTSQCYFQLSPGGFPRIPNPPSEKHPKYKKTFKMHQIYPPSKYVSPKSTGSRINTANRGGPTIHVTHKVVCRC